MPLVTGAPAATTSPSAGGFGTSSYPSCTWATLPAASAYAGVIFRVADVGIAGVGIVVISDGTVWEPLGPQLFARTAVAVSLTGTTSETTLATVTIPAGAMGLNGGLLVKSRWSMPSSANNKIARHRLGGIGGSVLSTTTYTTNTFAHLENTIRNRNSFASQYGGTVGTRATDVVTVTSTVTPTTVDTSVAQDIAITGQLGLGSETLTLEGYEVWLLP